MRGQVVPSAKGRKEKKANQSRLSVAIANSVYSRIRALSES